MRFCCARYSCSWRSSAKLLVDRIVRVGARPDRDLPALELRDHPDRLVQQVAIVRNDDHRAAVAAHELLDALLAFEIQVVVRLVEQEQIRRPDDQPRQPHQLRLPAAQHADRLFEGFFAEA